MKIFIAILLISFTGCNDKDAPKLPRTPKSFTYLVDSAAFCRIQDDKIECAKNEDLICYSFDDNAMITKYIIELNKQCKSWKATSKPQAPSL